MRHGVFFPKNCQLFEIGQTATVCNVGHCSKKRKGCTGNSSNVYHSFWSESSIPSHTTPFTRSSWLDELLYVSWTSQLDVCSMFARSCKRGIRLRFVRLIQTPAYTLRDHGVVVRRAVCLFPPELLLVLVAPTHEGMARLN